VRRRTLLATVGTGVAASTAGCGMLRSTKTIPDPSVHTDSDGRAHLAWDDGGELATFGVDGGVSGGTIRLGTELWHREGTEVTGITLRLWMPEAESAPDVALISPVEGDSSPPPSVTLFTPDRKRGTAISIADLDDLADETISTIEFLVRPRSETATAVVVDAAIELTETDWLGDDYDLDGRLPLDYPAVADREPTGAS
jgi:hypothetical protein